ncbi:MAG: hypothetical protein HY981_02410 [Candidatus Magasanikbacteria bacterium]|nr:hypothetical protein [Candidatus Magasanikbacteria bacterium]
MSKGKKSALPTADSVEVTKALRDAAAYGKNRRFCYIPPQSEDIDWDGADQEMPVLIDLRTGHTFEDREAFERSRKLVKESLNNLRRFFGRR